MNDAPPMTLDAKLQRRAGTVVYQEGQSRAERFVDDVTLLRMTRLRMPLVNPELFGFDNETIKAAHTSDAQLEKWQHEEDKPQAVDVAFRWPCDGSLAVRIAATQRWEVWRTW